MRKPQGCGFLQGMRLVFSNHHLYNSGGMKIDRKEAIRGAYRLTGSNSIYDGMLTCTTLRRKAVCRLVWDMDKAE